MVDIFGYFTTESAVGGSGGGFVPIDHTRVVDTRVGTGTTKATIPSNGTRTVTLTGGAVPSTATSVVVDMAVPAATVAGWVSGYPYGGTATAIGMLHFGAANTSGAAVVKLSTDGKATFVNHSAAAIDLVISTEGYFTASNTTGAGLRVASATLVDTRTTSTPIAAGATMDVAVAGASGLPTRSISAAVLTLTAANQTVTGTARVWPVGGTEPSTSVLNFASGYYRTSMVTTRLGTDGKVRIRNNSTAPLDLIVDVKGWFADPLPSLAVDTTSRPVAFQASLAAGQSARSVEYAYTDAGGALRYGHQPDPARYADLQWTSSLSQEAFTGTPGLAEQGDGLLQLTGHLVDSSVTTITEATKYPQAWGSWAQLGGSMVSPPVFGKLSDTLVQFAVDTDGQLWDLPQSAVNGPYKLWHNLGDVDLAGSPTVVTGRDTLQLFGITTSGELLTTKYSLGGVLSGWTSLGTGWTGSPAAVVYPGYLMGVFARAADGTIQTKRQDTSGVFPDAWSPVGSFVAAGSPAALRSPVTGLTGVVARGADGQIYVATETAPGSGLWGSWGAKLQDVDVPAATDPSVYTLSDSNGEGWGFVFRSANSLGLRAYTTNSGLLTESSVAAAAAAASLSAASVTAASVATDADATAVEGSVFSRHALPVPPK